MLLAEVFSLDRRVEHRLPVLHFLAGADLQEHLVQERPLVAPGGVVGLDGVHRHEQEVDVVFIGLRPHNALVHHLPPDAGGLEDGPQPLGDLFRRPRPAALHRELEEDTRPRIARVQLDKHTKRLRPLHTQCRIRLAATDDTHHGQSPRTRRQVGGTEGLGDGSHAVPVQTILQ